MNLPPVSGPCSQRTKKNNIDLQPNYEVLVETTTGTCIWVLSLSCQNR